MSSALTLTLLILSFLTFISVFYTSKNKNTESYQGVLTISLLLSAKVILYCLELFYISNAVFVSGTHAINTAITPVIASLVLLTSLVSSKKFSHSKEAKQTICILAFFFIGVIITNPFHHLAFTLDNVNTFSLGYQDGMLLHISKIYSGICILVGFIISAFSSFTNSLMAKKLPTYLGYTFAMLIYFLSMYVIKGFTSEVILFSAANLILYFYIFKNNEFNFIPVIKDNTFELINDGVLVVNRNFVIKDYNKSLTKLFTDIDFSKVIGLKADEVFRFYPVVVYAIKSNKNEKIKIKDKEYSIMIYSSIEKHKRNIIYTLTFKETSQFDFYDNVSNDRVDPITKLPNKRAFIDTLNHELNNAVRYNLPYCLLYIKVKNLYDVKESCGEIAGNLLLTDVSTLIKREIRKTDVLSRIESDTFALLLTHTNTKYIKTVCERIKKRVEKHSLAYEDKLINAETEIGATGANDVTNLTLDIIINKVEVALTNAKDSENFIETNFIN
ncbi:MAG: diguanylate cyclase [Clostridia bacterium]|nr:diguanylate cyclase [Clostridia bacterium]